MNATEFAAASFDAVSWVNGALQAQPNSDGPDGGVDAVLSSTIVRLQLLSQECSDCADSHMTRILSSMPRARRELKSSVTEVAALTTALASLSSVDVASVPPTAGAAALPREPSMMEQLEELHAAKTRLEAVRSMLEQSAAWDRVSRETEAVFESHSLLRVAEHLAALEKSATSLAGLPGASERAGLLANVRRSFDDVAAPAVADALLRHDIVALRGLVRVHASVRRPLAILDAIAAGAVVPLISAWRAVARGDAAGDGAVGQLPSHVLLGPVPLPASSTATAVAQDLIALAAASVATQPALASRLSAYYAGVIRVVCAEMPGVHALYAAGSDGAGDMPQLRALQAASRIIALATGGGRSPLRDALQAVAAVDAAVEDVVDAERPAAVRRLKSQGGDFSGNGETSTTLASLLGPVSPPSADDYRAAIDAAASAAMAAASAPARDVRSDDISSLSVAADCFKGAAIAAAQLGHVVAVAADEPQHVAEPHTIMTETASQAVEIAENAFYAVIGGAVCEALASPYTPLMSQFRVLLRDDMADVLHASAASRAALPHPRDIPSPANAQRAAAPPYQQKQQPESGSSLASAMASLTACTAALPSLGVAAFMGVKACDTLTLMAEASGAAEAVDELLREWASRQFGGMDEVLAALTAAADEARKGDPSSSAARAAVSRPVPSRDWLDEDAGVVPASSARGAAARMDNSLASATGAARAALAFASASAVASSSLSLLVSLLSAALYDAVRRRRRVLRAISFATTAASSGTGASAVAHPGILVRRSVDETGERAGYTRFRVDVDLRIWSVGSALRLNPRRRVALDDFLGRLDAVASGGVEGHLLPAASATAEGLAAAAFRSGLRALLAPVAAALRAVPGMDVWSSSSAATAVGGDDVDDEDGVSLYSQPPSPYAVAAGEALMAAAQMLAPERHPLVVAATASASASAPQPLAAPLLAVPVTVLEDPTRALVEALSAEAGAAPTAGPPVGSTSDGDAWTASEGTAVALPLELLLAAHAASAAVHLPHAADAEEAAAAEAAAVVAGVPLAGADVDGNSQLWLGDLNAAAVAARVSALQTVAARVHDDGHSPRVWLLAGPLCRRGVLSGDEPALSYTPWAPDAVLVLAGDVAADEATLWLHAVVRGACALMLTALLAVPVMDARGARQAVTDGEYLATVVGTLGAALPQPLRLFLQLLQGSAPDDVSPAAAALRAAVAKLRGY